MYHGHISLVKKSNDISCTFSKPIHGNSEIATLPDPVPHEVNGVPHFAPATGKGEKFLPSTMKGVEKGPQNIPFNPSAHKDKINCEV